jgi:hypothetical protein
MRKLLTLTCSLSVVTVESAHADYWINWPNGQSTYVTDAGFFFFMGFAILVLIIVGVATSLSEGSTSDSSLSAVEQAQQYDDEAAQYRAMSRKLDAETDLAESLIKAKRTRAELDDVEEFLRDDKRRRRR